MILVARGVEILLRVRGLRVKWLARVSTASLVKMVQKRNSRNF